PIGDAAGAMGLKFNRRLSSICQSLLQWVLSNPFWRGGKLSPDGSLWKSCSLQFSQDKERLEATPV
ncbi:MAG: hypothetical protein LJE65_14250, partial [Desulfobacteraceae bacterium]|nr:hypothetical protein [Desulfobacteraceae bacterium]